MKKTFWHLIALLLVPAALLLAGLGGVVHIGYNEATGLGIVLVSVFAYFGGAIVIFSTLVRRSKIIAFATVVVAYATIVSTILIADHMDFAKTTEAGTYIRATTSAIRGELQPAQNQVDFKNLAPQPPWAAYSLDLAEVEDTNLGWRDKVSSLRTVFFFARTGLSSQRYKIISTTPAPSGEHMEHVVSLRSYEVWIYDYPSNTIIGRATLNPEFSVNSWKAVSLKSFIHTSLSAVK